MKLCNSSIILCLLRLALQFANCQLLQSGQKSLPCEASERVSSCLERVDTNAWTSYTSFYTHTHNMCYFLKSQQWQVSCSCRLIVDQAFLISGEHRHHH